MSTDCVNCKHARLWTDKEQFEYIERIFNSIGRILAGQTIISATRYPKEKSGQRTGKHTLMTDIVLTEKTMMKYSTVLSHRKVRKNERHRH